MPHPDAELMREIIHDQWTIDSIFAAVVDAGGRIVSKGKTTIWSQNDPTAHAEVNAIREACRIWGSHRLPPGFWLYSTFEPCPLCASAVIWAGIEGVVYSNNPDYRGPHENWSFLKCRDVLAAGRSITKVELHEDFLIDEIKGYFLRG